MTTPDGPKMPTATVGTLRLLNNWVGNGLPTIASDAPPTGADRMAVAFTRLLRDAGLTVPLGSTVSYAHALVAVGLDRRAGVYWAGRATLVRRPEDISVYNKVFGAFWQGRVLTPGGPAIQEQTTVAYDDQPDGDDPDGNDDTDDDQGETQSVRYSRIEILRHKDFAQYSADDFAESAAIIAALKLSASLRRCRRLVPAVGSRATTKPDLRRTVRRALRTDGTPISRAYLEPSMRPRRIVLVVDVSGSMESYARALLRFAQAAVVGRGKVEVFALGTRLTRLTRELSSRDPDLALEQAAKRVVDWSGGTRLGDGIKEFNDRWAVRGMARGAIVVILSDGWDRGDPEVLGAQMQRLHRVTHRIVWVNPLKAAPGYAPLARGMAAALPYVDEFIEGHSLASLERLATVVAS